MVMSRDQNAGRNHSVRIDNSTFERVEEFKYLGKTVEELETNLMSLVIFITLNICSTCFEH